MDGAAMNGPTRHSTSPPIDGPDTADVTHALSEPLCALAGADPGSQAWRWRVRRSLAGVRDVLEAEPVQGGGWLAARVATSHKDRQHLHQRVHEIGPRVLEDADHAAVAADLRRLLADVQRHFQRVNDLAYDDVELELGGSE